LNVKDKKSEVFSYIPNV